MENINEFQEILERMLKEQEEKLTKKFEKEKQALISLFEQREKEWSSIFDVQTETVAKGVSEHIGKKVIESYADKFGEESEATQHAKDFPFNEQYKIAKQLMNENGEIMTADEFSAKHSTTWDEFNYMGGLTPQVEQTQTAINLPEQDPLHGAVMTDKNTFDPFKEQTDIPLVSLDNDTKDIISAIDYQVQNFTNDDNFPIEKDLTSSPTIFGKEKVQSAIKSIRTSPVKENTTTVSQEHTDTSKAQEKAVNEPVIEMTKQDNDVMPTITPEMLAEAKQSSQFMSDAEYIRKTNQADFPEIESYRTISPSDPALSLDTLWSELSKEKFGVTGNSKELVNYFDKVRHFDFQGKTAEEYRDNAVEKKDLKSWLQTFNTKTMNDAHESELRLMPFDATDRDVEEMKLKHQVEKKYFELSEKNEMSQVSKLFKNELPENLPSVAKVTQKEMSELKDLFRDYAAHRMGERWKHTYKNKEQDPYSQKRVSKEEIVRAMQRNQELKNIANGRNLNSEINSNTKQPENTTQPYSKQKVKNRIKAIRMN